MGGEASCGKDFFRAAASEIHVASDNTWRSRCNHAFLRLMPPELLILY